MTNDGGGGLDGLTVLAFESRRAAEMAELIRRRGGTPVSAPSMREVPLDTSPEAAALIRALEAGTVDVMILLTGVGTRALAAASGLPGERFAALLRRARLVARGPKPVAALRELGLTADVTVPEPNTWRELLATLDGQLPVAGQRVAVQEYGRTNPELIDGLQARGATVSRVPIYRWDYPEDAAALREGVARLAAASVDLALFTSARQVDHVIETARRLDCLDALHAASRRVVFASIGPVCSEALQAHGLPVDLEPEHPKMGQLVGVVAQRGRALVDAKRGGGG
ncbi:MAG TPA: uroporphyrinogen-III synthase [Candidatus Dormibacteraeota bacterium]|nr:uroporphyrinogen-III synthase [Candidatus Dormibacteraeota bacterium]